MMGNLVGAVQVQEVQSEGDWMRCSPVPSKYYKWAVTEENITFASHLKSTAYQLSISFFPMKMMGFLTHFLQVLPAGNV